MHTHTLTQIRTHIRAGVGEASKQEGAEDSTEAPSLSLEEPVQGEARRANPPTRAECEMRAGTDRNTDRTKSKSKSQSETFFMPPFGTQEKAAATERGARVGSDVRLCANSPTNSANSPTNSRMGSDVDYLLQACSVLGVGRIGHGPRADHSTSRVRGNAEENDEVLEERGAQEKGVREVMARKAERETGMKKKVGEEAEEEARHPETPFRCANCKENHKGGLHCKACSAMGHVCSAVQGSKRTDTRKVKFKCPYAAEILEKSAPCIYTIQSRY